MTFTVKKIRGIEKNVCFGEQKIAYNYALSFISQIKEIYSADVAELVRQDAINELINLVVKMMQTNDIDKKYNIDAIVHCFRNGIEEFAKEKYNIYTDYRQIGSTFKCLYDIA